MAGFGVNVDYAGLESDDWELQSSQLTPESASAEALDENGDVDAETVYAETASAEVVYVCTGNGTDGDINLPSGFRGGDTHTVGTNTWIITGGTLKTSNKARPELTVTLAKYHGPATAVLAIYDFATAIGSISALKTATAIGFTVSSGALNDCTVKCTTELAQVLDADGAVAIKDISKGRLESTGSLVGASAAPTATVAANWTKMKADSLGEKNTEYNTGEVNVFRNLAPEA